MRFGEDVTKKLIEHLKPEHFKEDTVLRMVAEKDLALAMDIMNIFGGSREYIHTPIQACDFALKKYIRGERNLCRSLRMIGLELGLTDRQMGRFKSYENGPLEPLPDIPE